MRDRLPIQPSGWVVFAVGVFSLVGAFALSWRELLVLALGCGVVLLISIPFVLGRDRIDIRRTLEPDRVVAGEPAVARIEAHNPASLPTPPRTVTDTIDGEPVPVPLPAIGPGETTAVDWELPTERRGRYTIGPARITKSDPCRLMARDVGQTGADHLWVHPRTAHLPAILSGFTKDMDGPTTDQSPAGDVAFHAIRPYRTGDDARHVHWMATARANELMVRHFVDNRQPNVLVVLDTAPTSWRLDESFEHAVSIAGSLALTAMAASHPTALRAGGATLVGRNRPSIRRHILDDLALIEQRPIDLGEDLGPTIAIEGDATSVFIVTGPAAPPDLAITATTLARSAAVTLIEVDSARPIDLDATPSAAIGTARVQLIAVRSLDELRLRLGVSV